MPEIEIDDTKVQAKGSFNAGRNHTSPASKNILQFATGVERVDLTTRRDAEQEFAERELDRLQKLVRIEFTLSSDKRQRLRLYLNKIAILS